MSVDISKLPTEFRGCTWNDGWEFGAPAVVYLPEQYRAFGDHGDPERVVDEICERIALGLPVNDGGLESESKWRGWGMNFAKRKSATHYIYRVVWTEQDGELVWGITEEMV